MRTNGNINNCGGGDEGYLIAASSIASVHFCPCHVKSSGIAISRSTCAPALRSSPPVVWTARGRFRAGPKLHSWLCVPLFSILASHDEPPFALSLHLMFCGTLMHPPLACVAALHCALGMNVPLWWCRLGSAGSWASRFWSSYSFRFIAVGPSFSCFDLCEVAHDPGRFVVLVRVLALLA